MDGLAVSSRSFKAQVIAEFVQPDTSITNVALTHKLNANLFRKWIWVQAQKNLALQTDLIPVKALASAAKSGSSLLDDWIDTDITAIEAVLARGVVHADDALVQMLTHLARRELVVLVLQPGL